VEAAGGAAVPLATEGFADAMQENLWLEERRSKRLYLQPK